MTRNSNISDADRELFRRSVGAVKKIRQDRLPARAPRSTTPAPLPEKTTAATRVEETHSLPMLNSAGLAGAELVFKRPGIQDQLFQKLRKGKVAIERELDLHGLTSTDAQEALGRFLDHCRQHHIRCARIIHGKGRGSREGKPVIKNKLNLWLRKIPLVLAFCPARVCDGGTGAVYVLLKITQ